MKTYTILHPSLKFLLFNGNFSFFFFCISYYIYFSFVVSQGFCFGFVEFEEETAVQRAIEVQISFFAALTCFLFPICALVCEYIGWTYCLSGQIFDIFVSLFEFHDFSFHSGRKTASLWGIFWFIYYIHRVHRFCDHLCIIISCDAILMAQKVLCIQMFIDKLKFEVISDLWCSFTSRH